MYTHVITYSPFQLVSEFNLTFPPSTPPSYFRQYVEYSLSAEIAHYLYDFVNEFKIYEKMKKLEDQIESPSSYALYILINTKEEMISEHGALFYLRNYCEDGFRRRIERIIESIDRRNREEAKRVLTILKSLGKKDAISSYIAHFLSSFKIFKELYSFKSLEEFREFVKKPIDEFNENEIKLLKKLET